MKKIIILLLAFVLVFSFVACDEEEKADKKVNESVSGIEENKDSDEDVLKVPTPDEEYLLYKETYTKNGNYCLYDYNEKGHVIKYTWYYQNGETMETNYTYTYNDDGSYSVYIEGIGKRICEYDSKGRLIKETSDPTVYPVTTTYIYDDADRVIETKTLAEEKNHIRAWHKNTYDENGNLVKDEMFLTDGSSGGWYEYDYDENGNEIQKYEFYPDGTEGDKYALYVWEYEYDEYGRVILKQRRDVERGGVSPKYTYEYDEKGGLIKETDSSANTTYEYRPMSECAAN